MIRRFLKAARILPSWSARPVAGPSAAALEGKGSGTTIRLVVVYFGGWPPWFPAFLHSCRFNPQVDWLILSDAAPPPDAPSNVRFLPLSMKEFAERAARTLGLPIAFDNARKVCDFRP